MAPLAAMLALVAVVVAAARPAPATITANPAPLPTLSLAPAPTWEALPALSGGDSLGLRILAYVAAGLFGLFILGLVGALIFHGVRYLIAAFRSIIDTRIEKLVEPDRPTTGLTMAGVTLDEAELADAVTAALARLDRAATPDDAVVLAWLELEAAAARHGAARDPAQTPTEFTTALLATTRAPRHAVGTLRGLYQRVRFGGEVATGEAVAAARQALEQIARVLETEDVEDGEAADTSASEVAP